MRQRLLHLGGVGLLLIGRLQQDGLAIGINIDGEGADVLRAFQRIAGARRTFVGEPISIAHPQGSRFHHFDHVIVLHVRHDLVDDLRE